MSLKETQLQSLVVDVVKQHGGAAKKLSNRFLVGIPDLLVKLPYRSALLVEVKLDRSSKYRPAQTVMPDVTVLQFQVLKEFEQAGMACGVLSFIEIGGKGLRGLYGTIDPLNQGLKYKGELRHDEYMDLTGPRRSEDILLLLQSITHVEK